MEDGLLHLEDVPTGDKCGLLERNLAKGLAHRKSYPRAGI